MAIKFDDQDPPRPPDLLIDRVTPCGVRAQYAEMDRAAFDASGQRSVRDIEAALASIGRELESFPRILDFGCGCGRVTRWLAPLTTTVELHACDIDEQAVAWDTVNLPFCNFSINGSEPPLPYPDDYFDLIMNHSVLTHLDERMQDLWLPELRRVLRQDGIGLLSVHGQRAFDILEQYTLSPRQIERWRHELQTHGILFVADDAYIGSSHPDFYHTTFHAPWYVFDHWTQWFDIRAYLPRGDLDHQDIVLLQKVESKPNTSASLARPQPALPDTSRSSQRLRARLRRLASSFARRVTDVLVRRFPTPSEPEPAESETARSIALALAIARQQGERITRLEAIIMDGEP